MQPRALKRLMQLGPEKRLASISEGLGLLAENVAALGADLELLRERERGRSLWILAGQADEEAAKALMLLDLVRMDQRDQKAMVGQIARFYDHLARCIYAEVTQMSPADFAEVRRMVDSMRPSHYLDGPNEVDWIFRNRLLAAREEGLYVDLIHEAEGDRWVTPASNEKILFGGPSPSVRELIGALHRLGATSPAGLALAAEAWDGRQIAEETHWQEIVAINREVVARLDQSGLVAPEASEEDARRVIDGWTFPLSGLELDEIKVSSRELEAVQERWAPD